MRRLYFTLGWVVVMNKDDPEKVHKGREVVSWLSATVVFSVAIFYEVFIDGAVVTIHGDKPPFEAVLLFIAIVSLLLKMFFKSYYSKRTHLRAEGKDKKSGI